MAFHLNDKTVVGSEQRSFLLPKDGICPGFATKLEGLIWECTDLDFAIEAFVSKPRGEEGGRVKVILKVAYCLGGRYGRGLVDCYRPINELQRKG